MSKPTRFAGFGLCFGLCFLGLWFAACAETASQVDDDATDDGGGGQRGDKDDEQASGAAGETEAGSGGQAGDGEAGEDAGGPPMMAADAMAGTSGTTGGQAGSGTAPLPVPNKPPKFIETFESVAAGSAPGAPFAGANSATVSEAQSYSGKRSLRMTNGRINFSNRSVIAAGKSYYIRFMVWMESAPPGNGGHYDMVSLNGSFSGDGQTLIGFYAFGAFNGNGNGGSQKVQIYGNVAGKTADCSKSAPLALTPKKWHCVELKVDDQDFLNFGTTIDGNELQNFSFPYNLAGSNCVPGENPTNGKWYLPQTINNITFQYRAVHGDHAMTLYFDDIAFSDSAIGCPKM